MPLARQTLLLTQDTFPEPRNSQTYGSHTEPQQHHHDCYKNWGSPSSSMETDILVQGFKEVEMKYGLYTTFTGDGDSSVHASLVTEVPGWGHTIHKIACVHVHVCSPS